MPQPALRHPRRRPDPARGIFETLLVRDGAAVDAEAHLARLAASARTLYGLTLPERQSLPNGLKLAERIARPDGLALPERQTLPNGLAEEVARAANAAGGGRLRIALMPDGATTVTTAAASPRELPVVLVPFALPGGLGAHKWLDRDLLDELTAAARARTGAANATPLLLDGAGNVLEAAWASVFAIERGALVTPPLDGRILPSVSRARMLAAARSAGGPAAAVETALPLARLAAADEIVLTSALGEARAVLATTAAATLP